MNTTVIVPSSQLAVLFCPIVELHLAFTIMFRRYSALKSVAAVCGVGLGLTILNQNAPSVPSHLKHQVPFFSQQRLVFSDQPEKNTNDVSSKTTELSTKSNEEKEMTEEEKWALKGEQCPLCKMALASPCIAEFKVFDSCLEKLKAKYGDEKYPDDEGMECFSGFHACMFANLEFFKKYVEEREAEEGRSGSDVDEEEGKENTELESNEEVNNSEGGTGESDSK